jgi:hypothetical protein
VNFGIWVRASVDGSPHLGEVEESFLERVESGESVVVSISGVEEWQSLQ